MENTHNFSAEELKNCPYHQMLKAQNSNNNNSQGENTGDWAGIDQNDEAGTDPDRNETQGRDNLSAAERQQ